MTKKLLENNKVEITTVAQVDRYQGFSEYSQIECEMIVEDIISQNKIWTMKHSRRGYDVLDTKEDWEPEGNSVEKDIESFQQYLDDTYGKGEYKAYALGVYDHSMISFSFNTGEDNRCKWDSGTCGFIGLSKYIIDYFTKDNRSINQYANMLSDAWNGNVERYYVIDNLTDEEVDCILSTESCEDIIKWKKHVEETYGVKEFEAQ